jgi:hypothetical protein
MSNKRRGLPRSRSQIEQIFLKLTPAQIRRIAERGHIRAMKLGEVLADQGETNIPFIVVVSSELDSAPFRHH